MWSAQYDIYLKIMSSTRIAIFASGRGTNAEKIIDHFAPNEKIHVTLVLTNNPKAGVLDKAKDRNIPFEVYGKNEFNHADRILRHLNDHKIDFIALAGFLLLVPEILVKAYPQKIINIHPALLPKFGGKGMYGKYVHQAVIENNEKKSGITIHYVNEHYDEGDIIFQKAFDLSPHETTDSLTRKVQRLEHKYYPKVIESLINESSKNL